MLCEPNSSSDLHNKAGFKWTQLVVCAILFLVVGRGFLDGEEGILLYLKNTFTGVISTTAEHVGVCK